MGFKLEFKGLNNDIDLEIVIEEKGRIKYTEVPRAVY
jgi:hypothetical protein